MFNIKKTRKPGVCAAMRCNSPCTDMLCPRHEKEWTDAGSPALTTAAPAASSEGASGTDLALQTELTDQRHRLQQSLSLIQALPCETEEQRAMVAALIVNGAAQRKALEEKRTAITKPMLAAKRAVDALFAPAIELADSCIKALKDKESAFQVRLLQARDAALKEIAAGAGTASPQAYALAHANTEAPSGLTHVQKFTYAVDVTKLPDEYFVRVVDYDRIKREVQAQGKAYNVPGVTVIEEVETRTTGRA